MSLHRPAMKLDPLSLVQTAGQPKWATQWWRKALAQASEVGSVTGIACMYRLVLHMTESKYLKPLLSGRGPTKSTWTWLKR